MMAGRPWAGQTRHVIELRAGGAGCTISPDDGGRVAQLTVDGHPLLVPRADEPEHGAGVGPMAWGSYPMAPWAGRVRSGRFVFDGRTYQLEINHAPNSIHGTVFTAPWSVSELDDRSVSMSRALGDHWPFGGVAHQHIELHAERLVCRLAVTADDLAMPAQVGWHPWFAQPDEATLAFATMYRRDDTHIPTGELVPVTEGPWDDCFLDPLGPLTLRWGQLTVEVTSDCSHWVVFDRLHYATCVEPQSGPPDGFNRGAGWAAGTGGSVRLEPGERLERTMTLSWSHA